MLFCETGAPGAAGLRFASVGAGRVPPARSTVLRAHRKKKAAGLPEVYAPGTPAAFLYTAKKHIRTQIQKIHLHSINAFLRTSSMMRKQSYP